MSRVDEEEWGPITVGYYKQKAIEEEDMRRILCPICEDRARTQECPRCGELTVCNWCAEREPSAFCDDCSRPLE